MGSKCFCGEVWTNAHPEIMQAMAQANDIAVDGKVGRDGYSLRAAEWMQREFDRPVFVSYTYNGTAANILALKSMLKPWDSILCAECTHINTHECGATEYMLGNKLLTIPSEDGKLRTQDILIALKKYRRFQYAPKVLAITQPTELGVLYTNEELRALCNLAHEKGMYVFVDGARITHALAALNTDLKTMIEQNGVDVFTYGGTKAGLMFGEMVIFLREEFAENLPYSQKQSLQHMDKSKFMGVQFEYLLRTGLWRKTAGHANRMAQLLRARLDERGIRARFPVDANMVFVQLTQAQMSSIQTAFDLNYWDEDTRLVRFAATHETTEEMIEQLISLL